MNSVVTIDTSAWWKVIVSVNVGPPDKNGLRVCQLSDSYHIQHSEDLKAQEGSLYWATQVK